MILKSIIAIGIFIGSMLQSRLANKCLYAMHDHRAWAASWYDRIGNYLSWGVALFIWGNLIVNLSMETFAWTIIWIICDCEGDPLMTYIDVKNHRKEVKKNGNVDKGS